MDVYIIHYIYIAVYICIYIKPRQLQVFVLGLFSFKHA